MEHSDIRKNSLPSRLVEAIDAGGVNTRSGWGRFFNKTPWQITMAMARLRKHGRMIFPVGGKNTMPITEGVLKDISLSSEDTREAMRITKKQYLSPQLQTAFRIQEDAVINHPEMYDEMESSITEILTSLLIAKENFKKYGNNRIGTPKN